jgi:hypothetical protein
MTLPFSFKRPVIFGRGCRTSFLFFILIPYLSDCWRRQKNELSKCHYLVNYRKFSLMCGHLNLTPLARHNIVYGHSWLQAINYIVHDEKYLNIHVFGDLIRSEDRFIFTCVSRQRMDELGNIRQKKPQQHLKQSKLLE